MTTTLTPIELIAVGFFSIVVVVNMLIGVSIILHGRHHQKQAMIALKGIGDTHLLAFEAHQTELDRLKIRVQTLERELGVGKGKSCPHGFADWDNCPECCH